MDILNIITVLIVILVAIIYMALFKKNRSVVIAATASILVLAITQIAIKREAAGFADYVIPFLCIAHLIYHWRFAKG